MSDRVRTLTGPRVITDEKLIADLLAAHDSTGLDNSLYLAAALRLTRKVMPHFCQGNYTEGRIKCRICGANL